MEPRERESECACAPDTPIRALRARLFAETQTVFSTAAPRPRVRPRVQCANRRRRVARIWQTEAASDPGPVSNTSRQPRVDETNGQQIENREAKRIEQRLLDGTYRTLFTGRQHGNGNHRDHDRDQQSFSHRPLWRPVYSMPQASRASR